MQMSDALSIPDPDIGDLANSIRGLFAGILSRALKDIFKPTFSDHEFYKTQALHWITVDDIDSFTSFINICSYLDIDVDYIRRIISAELRNLECGVPLHIKLNLNNYKLRFEHNEPLFI
jgi:hypothetical protein